jgi:ABC-type phosphate transport system substrate-binding protein
MDSALLSIASLLWLVAGAAPSHQEPTLKPARYAVIVHVDNKLTESGDAARAVVKKLFLKDLSQWPDGAEAKAYAREAKSEAQSAFRQQVLDMSEAELARHWLKLKSMNGTTPPKEVDSDRLVLKYVSKNQSAFGIVDIATAKGAEGVRTLFEF